MIQRFRALSASHGRRSRRGARGAAAVEFALIVTFVLAPLLVGMIQTGWSLYNAMSITGAIRDGARFAATGDASVATWTGDVTAQVRSLTFASSPTQANQTSICVGLYKQTAAAPASPVLVKSSCSVLTGPPLDLSNTTAPVTNLSLSTGQCVVRALAARTYRVSFVLDSFPGVMTRGSVARYERGTC